MPDLGIAVSVWALSLLTSWLLTGWIRRRALKSGMLDRPNERSSHTVPTPRGGGLAILLASGSAAALAIMLGWLPAAVGVAVLPGCAAIGWIGWRDDRHGVPASIRLVVHLASGAWLLAVVAVSGAPDTAVPSLGAAVAAGFLWIAIVWAVNLYNFMDGTDGIAALQAVFIGLAGAFIASQQGVPALGVLLGAVAASACGFLIWNWHPARIFMGDVGSGSLGFLLAAAPVAVWGTRLEMLWPWAILWTTFWVDATVTLVRRVLGGRSIFDPHRSHAYQILARRWQSHARVAWVYGAVNVAWVMPIAIAAAAVPQSGALLATVAAAPVVVAALCVGAGRPDA